jgi:transposase
VVSDLIGRRPIWFGGEDRSEASRALFYDWLGERKSRGVRLAVNLRKGLFIARKG